MVVQWLHCSTVNCNAVFSWMSCLPGNFNCKPSNLEPWTVVLPCNLTAAKQTTWVANPSCVRHWSGSSKGDAQATKMLVCSRYCPHTERWRQKQPEPDQTKLHSDFHQNEPQRRQNNISNCKMIMIQHIWPIYLTIGLIYIYYVYVYVSQNKPKHLSASKPCSFEAPFKPSWWTSEASWVLGAWGF